MMIEKTNLTYNLSKSIFGVIINATLESYISQFPEFTQVSTKILFIQPAGIQTIPILKFNCRTFTHNFFNTTDFFFF